MEKLILQKLESILWSAADILRENWMLHNISICMANDAAAGQILYGLSKKRIL